MTSPEALKQLSKEKINNYRIYLRGLRPTYYHLKYKHVVCLQRNELRKFGNLLANYHSRAELKPPEQFSCLIKNSQVQPYTTHSELTGFGEPESQRQTMSLFFPNQSAREESIHGFLSLSSISNRSGAQSENEKRY